MRVHRFKRMYQIFFAVEDTSKDEATALQNIGFERMGSNLVRSFPENMDEIDWAYQNFQKHIETIISHETGECEVPWKSSLFLFLELMQNFKVRWWLIGMGALAVRGIPVEPKSLDIIVDEIDFPVFADLISNYLIEPLVTKKRSKVRWQGRAFLKTRIEFRAGIIQTSNSELPTETGDLVKDWLETIEWNDYKLMVPPLNLQLKIAEENNDEELVRLISDFNVIQNDLEINDE
ncbi:hypothetical protein KAJ27_18710 [bacterium]|nr:hypothetical protein [bacterium]